MFQVFVPLVVVVVSVVLGLKTLSFVRAERVLQQRRVLADTVSPGRQSRSSERGKSAEPFYLPAWMKKDYFFVRPLRAAGITRNPVLSAVVFVGGSIVLGLGVLWLSGHEIAGFLAFMAAWVLAFIGLRRSTKKRQELLDVQLAQALPQIAASVRSSLTFERALRVVTVHLQDPLRSEFSRVLSDVAYGVSLNEALEAMAERTNSADIKTLAAATRIRQGSGGSVASALSMVSARVNMRLKAARELKVEIASTRMAKWVVALAMPVIFMLMFTTNADFARFYVSESLGWTVLGIAVVMEGLGLLLSHSITALKR